MTERDLSATPLDNRETPQKLTRHSDKSFFFPQEETECESISAADGFPFGAGKILWKEKWVSLAHMIN